jgi:Raf kinase inhibitor-like YbhB/YbcL family protein
MRLVTVLILISSSLLPINAVAQQPAAPAAPSKFTMTTVYNDDDWIPLQYTCGVTDGSSPALQWSNAPQGTSSFAIVFHDTDAAPAKGVMDVTHWILWNIPGTATQLSEGMKPNTSPDGIQQGKNIRGTNGYQPPCPPPGSNLRPHHYVFELYALDAKLDLAAGSSREDLLKAMDGHVIGKATVVGLFGQGIDSNTWRWGIAELPYWPPLTPFETLDK